MSKKDKKSRILIGDRLLGTLLYTRDKKNRGYLKFSIKNKIINFVKSTDVPTKLPVVLKLNKPTSLEISYKFKDRLLGIKRMVDGKFEREFYKVIIPIESCLFILRVKDYSFYDKYIKNKDVLVLNPPSINNKSVAIIFSFLGKNGAPFSHPDYNCGMMGMIDLPEIELNKLCIGIAEDMQDFGHQDIQVLFPIFHK
ncbi:MAG: hypothetical protein WCW04_01210 [Candidatus Paceibacterota bacterium]